MTNTVEYKWEEIDSLEKLKLGDEVEYTCPGDNREFKYWGEVVGIESRGVGGTGEVERVLVSGDWMLFPSSLTDDRMKNKLVRKVAVFHWPQYVGACVESSYNGVVGHYVRVAESSHNQWVHAQTGEYYATWEIELTSEGTDLRVLGRGY